MKSTTRSRPLGLALCLTALLAAGPTSLTQPAARAGETDVVPRPGTFPAAGAGVYLAGELVAVDHVNRRGALRLVGDGVDDRYHAAPSHRFALLPYGTVRYHGAPAELRDVPIGTVLHGYFLLPPPGDTSVPPPKHGERYVPKQTQALSLEDDFSFTARQGRAWKVVAALPDKGTLKVSATAPPGGAAPGDGLKGEQTFLIDPSTRVWKGRQIAELTDLAAGDAVQLNLTWAPDWKNGQFHVADVWADKISQDLAAELQRRLHVRHQRTRWLAGWIDHVQHQPAGKGVVTVTLFGGIDPTLLADARRSRHARLAAAEPTLRSWWQDHDAKGGPVVSVKDLPGPPPGSSGVQLRVQIDELLEGFRPGRIVRICPEGFPSVKLPPEERVQNLEDR